MPLSIAEKILDLYTESKAYYRAFEVTGDESMLLFAWQLEDDACRLEIDY